MKNRIIILWWFPVLVGTVIFAGSLMVLWPQINNMINNYGTYQENKKLLALYQKKEAAMEAINMDEVLSMTKTAERALPKEKPFFEVLVLLQEQANKSGVALGKFELNPGSLATSAANTNNQNEQIGIKTSITVKGNKDQLNAFLDGLQTTVPLFMVEGVSITDEENDNSAIKLSLEIYYQPELVLSGKSITTTIPALSESNRQTLQTVSGYTASSEDAVNNAIANYGREDIFKF